MPETPEADAPHFENDVRFLLNGEPITLHNPDPALLLADYLRSPQVGLTGTKIGCGEGGCGACTVVLARRVPGTDRVVEHAINACLRPVCTLDGAAITTIEGLGSTRGRLNPIQERIACWGGCKENGCQEQDCQQHVAYSGTQCGYCTPGFVMNMYGLLRNNPRPSPQEVEDRFDGNLCRCTGYRPILDAMQTFAHDDAAATRAAKPLREPTPIPAARPVRAQGSGYRYFRPLELRQVFNLLGEFGGDPARVKLLNGNTSIGIYKRDVDDPKILVDISQVRELAALKKDDQWVFIGGGVTFARLLEFLTQVIADEDEARTKGLEALQAHVRRIGSNQIRAVATVGGNLMLARSHGRVVRGVPFVSDFLVVAAALGAQVALRTPDQLDRDQWYPILELPAADHFPEGLLITGLAIPFSNAGTEVRTYKVARRPQNAHALVNAAFLVELNGERVKTARLVFGGLARRPISAEQTAARLRGKPWTEQTRRDALGALRREVADQIEPLPEMGVSEEYRASLARALFFKYFAAVARAQGVVPDPIAPLDASAGLPHERAVSKGKREFPRTPFHGFVGGTPAFAIEPGGTPAFAIEPGFGAVAFAMAAAPVAPDEDLAVPAEVALPPAEALPAAEAPPPAVEAPLSPPFEVTFEPPKERRLPRDRPSPKVSAQLQATGEACYVLDEAGPPGTLHAAYVYSQRRHGRFDYGALGLAGLEAWLRREFPGFRAYVTSLDLPRKSSSDVYNGSQPAEYDPVFATNRVTSYGQPIGLVVADTPWTARAIALAVQAKIDYYEPLEAITSIEAARRSGDEHLTLFEQTMTRPGSDENWLKRPDQPPAGGQPVLTGSQRSGAAAHFYLETQVSLAIPGEGGRMTLYSSTQNLRTCQSNVARALKLPSSKVEARALQVGGAFGAKELRPPKLAVAAAVAARKVDAPVRLGLDRNTDMTMIGKQHPFQGRYWLSAKADDSLRIDKLRLDLETEAGSALDCSTGVMKLALLSADGPYEVPTFRVSGTVYRTNVEPRTAFRSFGIIQATLILEEAIEHLAYELGKQAPERHNHTHLPGKLPEDVREASFYPNPTQRVGTTHFGHELLDCRMIEIWKELRKGADFDQRWQAVQRFNEEHRWRKRGISMIPVKYGVGYTHYPFNQASAEVMVYQDGSVLVRHGGIEMGQGIETKVRQLAAEALGLEPESVQVSHADTTSGPNASSTGASTGTDLVGAAVLDAARKLRSTLSEFFSQPAGQPSPDAWRRAWRDTVKKAYDARAPLASLGFARPHLSLLESRDFRDPGAPEDALPGGGEDPEQPPPPEKRYFYYFTYSAAASEVEIDVLTGEFKILRSDIAYDAGQTLNSVLDFGQIEGGFVQGIGNLTTEQTYYAPDGRLMSNGTWDYKPPCSKTIPLDFNVGLLQYVEVADESAPPMDVFGIRSSKSTGEPPLVLGLSVFYAIKHAILAARQDAGRHEWFPLAAPATVERVQQACLVDERL